MKIFELIEIKGRRERMIVEFTTTYALNVCHGKSCEFESHLWRCVLDVTAYLNIYSANLLKQKSMGSNVTRVAPLGHIIVIPSQSVFVLTAKKEELEDIKGIIRSRISKKNRQCNGQAKKYKQRSTKHTHKTKDRVTRTPLKT